MTKRELVIQVANKLGMTQSDVAKVIEHAFESISKSLADGERWELRDFGVFEVKTRAARIGRNPRTGDQVPVPERRVVTFRPGKKMKEQIATPPESRGEGSPSDTAPGDGGESPPSSPPPGSGDTSPPSSGSPGTPPGHM